VEEELLKELYQTHSDSIYYFLARKSGSDELAFDLMQDTFIRADAYYKHVENPKAWLFRIARNLYIDYMKQQKNTDNSGNDDSAILLNLASEENLENNVNWKLLKNSILKKLAEENKIYPELFLLRLDYRLTHKEIADIVDIPFRTIRRYFEKIRTIIYHNFKDDLNMKSLLNNQEYGQNND
jgi:RNA polymerase sigma-70 factor (ECF subfamily)